MYRCLRRYVPWNDADTAFSDNEPRIGYRYRLLRHLAILPCVKEPFNYHATCVYLPSLRDIERNRLPIFASHACPHHDSRRLNAGHLPRQTKALCVCRSDEEFDENGKPGRLCREYSQRLRLLFCEGQMVNS